MIPQEKNNGEITKTAEVTPTKPVPKKRDSEGTNILIKNNDNIWQMEEKELYKKMNNEK